MWQFFHRISRLFGAEKNFPCAGACAAWQGGCAGVTVSKHFSRATLAAEGKTLTCMLLLLGFSYVQGPRPGRTCERFRSLSEATARMQGRESQSWRSDSLISLGEGGTASNRASLLVEPYSLSRKVPILSTWFFSPTYSHIVSQLCCVHLSARKVRQIVLRDAVV